MGACVSSNNASIYAEEQKSRAQERVGRDEYLNSTGHGMYVYKFDALQGPDGCISRAQVEKINHLSVIRVISFEDLKQLGRLPKPSDHAVLKNIEDVRGADCFVVYLHTSWKYGLFGNIGITDHLLEKYNMVVDAFEMAIEKYARKMRTCYIFMEFASLPPQIDYSEMLDLAMGLSDWILSIPSVEREHHHQLHFNSIENNEAIRNMRHWIIKDDKAAVEVYYAAYMPHNIGKRPPSCYMSHGFRLLYFIFSSQPHHF